MQKMSHQPSLLKEMGKVHHVTKHRVPLHTRALTAAPESGEAEVCCEHTEGRQGGLLRASEWLTVTLF